MNFAKSNILIERLHSAKSDVSYSISMEFPAFCGTAANSPKRVYVSGLEFHSSEEKSARFTFSNMKGLPRLPWRNKLAKIGMSSPFIN